VSLSAGVWNCLLSALPFPVIEHHVIKAYWPVEVEIHELLIRTLGEGKWSALGSDLFTFREMVPGSPFTASCMCLDVGEVKAFSRVCRQSSCDCSVVHLTHKISLRLLQNVR
jgi:hypothetical protein